MVLKWKSMEEAAETDRRRRMITRSSINRKPLSNLTNIIVPKPHQSNKPKTHAPSTAADSCKSGSSIGSTQNPNNLQPDPVAVRREHLPTSTPPDDWLRDENHRAYNQGLTTQKLRSKTKSAANGPSLEKTWNDGKGRTVSLPCSTVEKLIDKGKAIAVPNELSLERTKNDGKERSTALSCAMVEKIKDKRKAAAKPSNPSLDRTDIDGKERSVALSCSVVESFKDKGKAIAVPANQPYLEKTRNNGKEVSVPVRCSTMDKTKDKGKAIAAPLTSRPSNAKNNMEDIHVPRSGVKIIDKGKAIAMPVQQLSLEKTGSDGKERSVSLPCSMVEKVKDKGKAIAIPASFPPVKNANNNSERLNQLISGVKIKDKGKAVDMGSGSVDLAKRDKGFNYDTLEKKDQNSCPPISKTRNNRNGVDRVEDILRSKSQTDPLPVKKRKRCSSKGDTEEYVLPQDFIDQQRAYFKEIDDFDLEVEEVSVLEDEE